MDLPIETKRLVLRDFSENDWEDVSRLYRLVETSRFECWDPIEDPDEIQEIVRYWIKRQSETPRVEFTLAVTLKSQGRFIGLCGLEIVRGTAAASRIGEVGYRYFPAFWNQGYATEALRGLMESGFEVLDLQRIQSGCVRENIASSRVLEKAGMTYEGCRRESFCIGETWHDYLLYGMLATDLNV